MRRYLAACRGEPSSWSPDPLRELRLIQFDGRLAAYLPKHPPPVLTGLNGHPDGADQCPLSD